MLDITVDEEKIRRMGRDVTVGPLERTYTTIRP